MGRARTKSDYPKKTRREAAHPFEHAMLAFVRLAFVFFAATVACTNDAFIGDAGGGDAAEDGGGQQDVTVGDAPIVDANPITDVKIFDAPPTWCDDQSTAVFCADFDHGETDAWTGWTSYTQTKVGWLTFGPGDLSPRGLAASPVALNVEKAYLTKTIPGAIGSLSFAIQLPVGLAGTTLMQLTAGANVLTFATQNLNASNFVFTGPSDSFMFGTDTAWHSFTVKFASGQANVTEDGTSVGHVTFSQSPQNFSVDIGYVGGGKGGTVLVDDVLML